MCVWTPLILPVLEESMPSLWSLGLLCSTELAVWLKASHCGSLGRLGLLGSTLEAEFSIGRPGA